MQANNLSISIANDGCNKNCPYCVSKMTGYITANPDLVCRNLKKVKKIIDLAQISSISITSKGEPTLNLDDVYWIITKFRDYPLELQTNGILLREDPKIMDKLYMAGLDTIAFSIDTLEDAKTMPFKRAKEIGLTTRMTLNVTDKIPSPDEFGFDKWLLLCKEYGIDQISLRKVTSVDHSACPSANEWIKKHAENGWYEQFYNQIFKILSDKGDIKPIRNLPYNVKIYDIDGVSVTMFDYCIQESNHNDDIRSLIWQEDGHLYTSWNSLASRIF